MTRRGRASFVVAVAAVAGVVANTGIPSPTPNARGTFSFAVLGDAPYYDWESLQYRLVLRDLNAHDLSLVLHIGDIFWRPCSDANYRHTLDRFNSLHHPVIYTPGDNEWTDCWTEATGRFQPRERLAKLRQILYPSPARSLGGRTVAVETQADDAVFAEFVENVRWAHQGIVFVTVHLTGSWNARDPDFRGRTAADDEESSRRTLAAAAWLREAFAAAVESSAAAVVVGFHANPALHRPATDAYRRSYDPFIATLEEEAAAFGKPVLVAQGDDHDFIVDRPLVRRSTGKRLDNLTRLQVPGSPAVGWVKVVVTPGAATMFAFEPRVIPRWKYW